MKRFVLIGVAVVLFLIVCLFVRYPLLLPTVPVSWTSPLTFDQTRWKQNKKNGGVFERQQMVQNAIRQFTFVGWTRERVERILGMPDDVRDREFSYYLGNEQGAFSFDSEWLFFELGPDDRVERVAVCSD